MKVNIIEVKMIGVEYVAFYHDKEISRGRSIVKVVTKLHKYLKGQE